MAFRRKQKRSADQQIALWLNDGDICVSGYTPLDQNPEVVTPHSRPTSTVPSMSIQSARPSRPIPTTMLITSMPGRRRPDIICRGATHCRSRVLPLRHCWPTATAASS